MTTKIVKFFTKYALVSWNLRTILKFKSASVTNYWKLRTIFKFKVPVENRTIVRQVCFLHKVRLLPIFAMIQPEKITESLPKTTIEGIHLHLWQLLPVPKAGHVFPSTLFFSFSQIPLYPSMFRSLPKIALKITKHSKFRILQQKN